MVKRRNPRSLDSLIVLRFFWTLDAKTEGPCTPHNKRLKRTARKRGRSNRSPLGSHSRTHERKPPQRGADRRRDPAEALLGPQQRGYYRQPLRLGRFLCRTNPGTTDRTSSNGCNCIFGRKSNLGRHRLAFSQFW